jgi:hypothetical protein
MMMVFASYGWENCPDARVWDEEIRLARLAADLDLPGAVNRKWGFSPIPQKAVAPQLTVVTNASARSSVAVPVQDVHAASGVPSETAAHETTTVRASSSHGP